MATFEHVLLVHVRGVNPHTEQRGDDSALAIDVSLRVMAPEVIDEILMPELLHVAPDTFEEFKTDFAPLIDSINLAPEFVEHRIAFYDIGGDDELAVLNNAKLNKFRFAFDDVGLTFRIQAEVDGPTAGTLCELIGQRVTIGIGSAQGELPFDK